MKAFAKALALAAFCTTTPAAASQGEPRAADAEPGQTRSDDIHCIETGPPTGSRIGPRRVCRTIAEWNALRSASPAAAWAYEIGLEQGNASAARGN